VVENYNGSSSLDAENLTRFIEAELTENKVVPVVSSDKVEVLRDADPAAFHGMTVQAIGKAVGATQILYVDKVEANVDRPEASDMVQGGLTANARIVSTDTGNSVWPAGTGAGMPFSVEVPFTPLSKTNPSDMRSALARSMAVQIVDTFHDHQPAASDVDNPQRP
jgi:hypothetical protein